LKLRLFNQPKHFSSLAADGLRAGRRERIHFSSTALA
jgi:hypothetical protein